MMANVAELELHNEVAGWLATLDDEEWDRASVPARRTRLGSTHAALPCAR